MRGGAGKVKRALPMAGAASCKLCLMAAEFAAVFATLKAVLVKHANRLSVKADTPIEYTLLTKSASPFPQHKGQPLYFGSVRLGKAEERRVGKECRYRWS